MFAFGGQIVEGVRTKKSIYNMTASIVYSVISLCFRFLVRRFFLDAFGITILGYYSTFNSIVGMLNMAELGIGTAIAFNLYKPAAEGDYNQINSYLNIYKKLYKIIGLVILVLGIVFIPFLPTIVGEDNSKLLYLGTIFVLQLLSTVATYCRLF